MFGLQIGLVIGGSIFTITLIAVAIYWLASNDLFFTMIREAEAKAVMMSQSFSHFVASGFKFDQEWNVSVSTKMRWFTRKTGLVWIGLPPFAKIYTYKMKWASRVQTTKDGQVVFEARQEEKVVDSIFLRDDVYTNTVRAAETLENIPVNVTYVVRARSVNPYKSLFGVQHWLEALHALIDQAGRDYIGTRQYQDLTSKEAAKSAKAKEGFRDWLDSIGVLESLEKDYGIKISSVDITEVDPAGELAKEFVQATTLKYMAEQEAKRKVIEATGQAKAIEKVAKAIRDNNEAGVLAVQTQALTELGKGEATKMVIPSSLVDILSNFGKRGNP